MQDHFQKVSEEEVAEFLNSLGHPLFAFNMRNSMYAIGFCLEALYRDDPDGIPEDVSETIRSLNEPLFQLANKFAEAFTQQDESKKQESFATFRNGSVNVLWPFALIPAIMAQLEIEVDSDYKDPVTGHDYFDPVLSADDNFLDPSEYLPERIIPRQLELGEALYENLSDFMLAASELIGKRLGLDTLNPQIAFEAIFTFMNECDDNPDETRDISEINIKEWFPQRYTDIFYAETDAEALANLGITVN